jgi:putative hemolysin
MNPTAAIVSPKSLALPVGTSAKYTARLAESIDDIRAAQRLRFEVFNLELDKGLDASYASGLDRDPFDEVCDHLLVFHTPSGELAGTYRLQTGPAALAGLGYYSAQEFDFAPFEPIRPQLIELGRACVHRQHRSLSALGVLWKAIAQYAQERNGRYLIGCSSLATGSPDAGWNVYAHLLCGHLARPAFRTSPLVGWECPEPSAETAEQPVPKLMQAYLSLGAKICGAPAWDQAFRTIDFLTLLDLDEIHPAARRRFLS